MSFICFKTFIGNLYITEKNGFISNISNTPQKDDVFLESCLLIKAKEQILEYFAKQRTTFNLPLNPLGSSFQILVWDQLKKIPYGQTVSYADIAKKINSSPRAIGMACSKNPLPLVVPCHRVIAKNGSLGGFSGFDGVNSKQTLIAFEADLLKQSF